MADPADDLLPLIGVRPDGVDNDEQENESDSLSGRSSTSTDTSDIEVDMEVINDDNLVGEDNSSGEEASENKRKKSRKRRREREKSQLIVNFDKSLPGTHSYLGNDMDELRGRTILEEDSIVSIPILILPNVVLVPGQVIPLYLNRFQTVNMVRQAAETDKTFGILNMVPTDDTATVSDVGCTAEIFSIKDESDSSLSILRAKAMGRQRFRVVDTLIRDIAGGLKANARILPELTVSHFLDGARVPSLSRFMAPLKDDEAEELIKTAVGKQGQVFSSVDFRPKNVVNKIFLSHSTSWPPWVYRLYDVDWLCQQIKKELKSWSGVSLPSDPVALSYWVAHNLPVDDNTRLFILSKDSVVQRLRFGLSVIKKTGVVLRCSECETVISTKEHVFSMTEQGPVGAYVNPGGYVHEMFTVYDAKNLTTVGRCSTEHSWFPGYAWTISQCKNCHFHMGWKFTAVKSHLAPRKFWGLCRSAIETMFSTTREDELVTNHPAYIM